MRITSLSLQNFRKFSSKIVEFDDQLTVLLGQNASGKTSVIEAIHLLGTGESFRAGRVDEMIQFDQELGRVKATVLLANETEPENLEILLTHGQVQGKKTAKRLYSLNDVRKRKADVVGKLVSVAFRPEDMRLVEGSPGRRRQFIDTALSMLTRKYAWSLATYEQALKQRNRLLLQVREGESPRTALHYWDLQLLKHGEIVQNMRTEFLNSFHYVDFPVNFQIEYLLSEISEARMAEYQDRSIASGHTLIGPHKDDFRITLTDPLTSMDNRDVALYGSRGQQRLAVLWLKICELAFSETKVADKPVLLLDDIMSELDEQSREKVVGLMEKYQTIISTTDEDLIEQFQQTRDNLAVITFSP